MCVCVEQMSSPEHARYRASARKMSPELVGTAARCGAGAPGPIARFMLAASASAAADMAHLWRAAPPLIIEHLDDLRSGHLTRCHAAKNAKGRGTTAAKCSSAIPTSPTHTAHAQHEMRHVGAYKWSARIAYLLPNVGYPCVIPA